MRKTLRKIGKRVFGRLLKSSAIGNWEARAKQYGPRAVLNLGHPDEEIDAITEMQKARIFPFLKQALSGHENTILDIGCGPGRFTPDLAKLIDGKAIGVDPIRDFLDMAQSDAAVEYRLMEESALPVAADSIDVVWICLVLGGLVEDSVLRKTVSEVDRVLKRGGLIVLTENTSEIKDGDYWKFRSADFYRSLFAFADLKHCSDYNDLGERISILVGNKRVQAGASA